MKEYILIICGAGLGGAFRYWLSNFVYKFLPVTFPYGTLSVNILGSFLLGIIIFYFDTNKIINRDIKLFLTIGFCGGFTTFSTFSLETVNLLLESEYLLALLNIFFSLILTIAAVFSALIIARHVIPS